MRSADTQWDTLRIPDYKCSFSYRRTKEVTLLEAEAACLLERASVVPRRLVRPFEQRASAARGAPLLGHPVGISAHRWGVARARARLLGGDLRAQNAERRDSLEDG